MSNPDWTSYDGKANSSYRYLETVEAVRDILANNGHAIVHGHLESVARQIVSHLAHVRHIGPQDERENGND